MLRLVGHAGDYSSLTQRKPLTSIGNLLTTSRRWELFYRDCRLATPSGGSTSGTWFRVGRSIGTTIEKIRRRLPNSLRTKVFVNETRICYAKLRSSTAT